MENSCNNCSHMRVCRHYSKVSKAIENLDDVIDNLDDKIPGIIDSIYTAQGSTCHHYSCSIEK